MGESRSRHRPQSWLDSGALGDGPAVDVPTPTTWRGRRELTLAMQLTPTNRVAVVAWVTRCGGHARIGRGSVVVFTGRRGHHAYVSDWLVFTVGGFVVVPDRVFTTMFEPGRFDEAV